MQGEGRPTRGFEFARSIGGCQIVDFGDDNSSPCRREDPPYLSTDAAAGSRYDGDAFS
jgi:hypothetical protein